MIPLFEGEHYAESGETENFAEGEGATYPMPFVTADIARLVLLLAAPSVSLWAMRLIE